MQGRPTRSDTHHPASPLSPTLSNPYPARAILRPMSHPPDLIHHGLEQARLALWAVINMTNAHLRPLTLRRSLKRRASGRLKQLEIIVRRLLTLMALALTLPAVRPRTASPLPPPCRSPRAPNASPSRPRTVSPCQAGCSQPWTPKPPGCFRGVSGHPARSRRALPRPRQRPLQGARSAGALCQTARAQPCPPAQAWRSQTGRNAHGQRVPPPPRTRHDRHGAAGNAERGAGKVG